MQTYHIAVLPGDGIGPEVTRSALAVLDAAASKLGNFSLSYEELSVGAGEYLKNGDPLPESALDRMRAADAIILGAMGLPSVRWPNGLEMTPQIDIREKLDLFNGVRPIKLYHPIHSPLKGFGGPDGKPIDFVIIRENCEGLFVDRLRPREPNPEFETDTLKITRHGAERVCREAFKLATKRRHHLTLVDKANVLPSMAFLRKIFNEIALEFPDVATDHVYVDAVTLFLVQKPDSYDVLVTENMFGDIISDLGAGIIGGMGMAPSADIGPKYALFQPSHGTAPSIAGQGIANPIATILSGALMLDWLGTPETIAGARLIEAAVTAVMSDPTNLTADLGGSTGTEAITAKVIAAL
jgi:3-isopropylmalate dehydrogenase